MARKNPSDQPGLELVKLVRDGDHSVETLEALYNVLVAKGTHASEAMAQVTFAVLGIDNARGQSKADLEKAVEELDAFAHKVDERDGRELVRIDADGASIAPWKCYYPIRGTAKLRDGDLSQAMRGGIFWNPVSSAVVHVLSGGAPVAIRSGTIDVDGELDEAEFTWDRFLAVARRWIESAYDDSRETVSRWVFDLASAAAVTILDQYGPGAVMIDDERVVAPEEVEALLNSYGVGVVS